MRQATSCDSGHFFDRSLLVVTNCGVGVPKEPTMISAQELTVLKLFSAAVLLAAVLLAFGPGRSASAEPLRPFFGLGHFHVRQ